MQIGNVSQNSMVSSRKNIQNKGAHQNSIKFGKAFVPTTEAYAAKAINQQLDDFNKKLLPDTVGMARRRANAAIRQVHKAMGITREQAVVKNATSFATDFDCFVLAGGPGSRFKELSDAIDEVKGHKEPRNKISTPFPMGKGLPDYTMATPILSLGAIFAAGVKKAKKAGTKTAKKAASGAKAQTAETTAKKASSAKKAARKDFGFHSYTKKEELGNFWHIVDYYMKHPKKIKNVVLLSGDNNFDIKSGEFLRTVVRMREEGQHMAAFGVLKEPKDVQGQLGVIGATAPQRKAKDLRALTDFVEKPDLDLAKKLAEPTGGINIANTGCLVISKEAMTAIVKAAKSEEVGKPGSFSRFKDGVSKDTDRFDFSTAQAWILKHMYKPEDIKAGKGPIVHMLPAEKWSDLGSPQAMYDALEASKQKGSFLQNLPANIRQTFRDTLNAKVNLSGDGPKYIIVSDRIASKADVTQEELDKAKSVLGVKIL